MKSRRPVFRLFADAAVLVAEAGRRHVGRHGNSAESANDGQSGDDAENDLLHNDTPFVNTKTICDSNTLSESLFFGHTGAATESTSGIVALYPERFGC